VRKEKREQKGKLVLKDRQVKKDQLGLQDPQGKLVLLGLAELELQARLVLQGLQDLKELMFMYQLLLQPQQKLAIYGGIQTMKEEHQ
jgi:hypothetical protein